MNKELQNFYNKKKDNISFITLKKGTKLSLGYNSYLCSKELIVPIEIKDLVNDIKEQDKYDGIKIRNIIEGIIFYIGVEEETKNIDNEYYNILKLFNSHIEAFIINNINNHCNEDEAVIYGSCLIKIKSNDKNCFVYANTLENKAIKYLASGLNVQAESFIKEAISYYEKSLDYNNEFALSYYKLGYHYKNKKHYIKAGLYWEKHIQFDNDEDRLNEIRNELDNLQLFINYEKGYNHVLNGKPQRGLDLLLPILEKNSGWWNLLFFIGLAYRTLKEYKIAEKYFENVIKLQPNQIDALNELGLCKICLKKHKDAVIVFSSALAINKDNTEILCNRATAYLLNNEIKNAEKDINKALLLDKNDKIAYSIKQEIEKIKSQ